MRDNGKKIQFAANRNRSEISDPSQFVDMAISGDLENFKEYMLSYPEVRYTSETPKTLFIQIKFFLHKICYYFIIYIYCRDFLACGFTGCKHKREGKRKRSSTCSFIQR